MVPGVISKILIPLFINGKLVTSRRPLPAARRHVDDNASALARLLRLFLSRLLGILGALDRPRHG